MNTKTVRYELQSRSARAPERAQWSRMKYLEDEAARPVRVKAELEAWRTQAEAYGTGREYRAVRHTREELDW